MGFMRAELEGTLEAPDLLRRSSSYPDTVRLYFRWYDHTVEGSKWVRVVVRFYGEADAFVLTAFVRDYLDGGEEIWRRTDR